MFFDVRLHFSFNTANAHLLRVQFRFLSAMPLHFFYWRTMHRRAIKRIKETTKARNMAAMRPLRRQRSKRSAVKIAMRFVAVGALVPEYRSVCRSAGSGLQ